MNNLNLNEVATLIELLRDRLEEACDCIEAGYEIVRSSGHSISDSQMTVEGGRMFIEEANEYLNTIKEIK